MASAPELNLGATKLRESGRSASAIAGFLAKRGVTVTRMTCSNWRSGKTVPPENARAVFAADPFYIPAAEWDRAQTPANALAAASMASEPSAPAPGVPGPTSADSGANAPPSGDRSAATLAAELLARIEGWRAKAEAEGTAAAAARFAELEGRAIDRLAKLRGEATSPEGELARSPQWTRLRSAILAVVAEHPPTARKLLSVLAAHGQPVESKGAT
jgi:hypothetical protein